MRKKYKCDILFNFVDNYFDILIWDFRVSVNETFTNQVYFMNVIVSILYLYMILYGVS